MLHRRYRRHRATQSVNYQRFRAVAAIGKGTPAFYDQSDADIEILPDPLRDPHKCLIFAVIDRAVKDLRTTDTQKTYNGHARHAAAIWVDDTAIAPFSFNWCIEQLDISPVLVDVIRSLAATELEKTQLKRA